MIIGVGTDLVDIRRIQYSVDRFGDRFVGRILAEAERREQLSGTRLAAYVARQFAAKEAVSKALGSGMRNGVYFTNILVLRDAAGAPFVELHAGARARAQQMDITTIQISLSDEKDYALAFAVALNQAAGGQ